MRKVGILLTHIISELIYKLLSGVVSTLCDEVTRSDVERYNIPSNPSLRSRGRKWPIRIVQRTRRGYKGVRIMLKY